MAWGFRLAVAAPPDPRHIPLFVETINTLDAAWASEHLSFNQANGPNGLYQTGFFLPPLQSPHGVACAVTSIDSVQSHLPVPFAIETGTNYLKPMKNEIDDGNFVNEVANQANCGILLDLHNIWANELNGRQSVSQYLDQLPLDRVWELHFAGGFEHRGYWLDAHSGAIPDAVIDIAADLIPKLPNLGAVIFELMPSFLPQFGLDSIIKELEKLRSLWALRSENTRLAATAKTPFQQNSASRPDMPHKTTISPPQWEDSLGALVTCGEARNDLGNLLSTDPAIGLLQELIGKFRAGALTQSLHLSIRLLFLSMGEEHFQRYLSDYFKAVPPQPFAEDEAISFAHYLRTQKPPVPMLPDVVGYELAAMEVTVSGKPMEVSFYTEPLSLLSALQEGVLPEPSTTEQHFLVTITP